MRTMAIGAGMAIRWMNKILTLGNQLDIIMAAQADTIHRMLEHSTSRGQVIKVAAQALALKIGRVS
jgi:hypothetical protein